MDNNEKLNILVNMAQTYIIQFLSEFMSPEELSVINSLFKTVPVTIKKFEKETSEFGTSTPVGGTADEDGITIDEDNLSVNINNEDELNRALAVLIHEYAHQIIRIKHKHGGMLEESFATLFAESCINNARLKQNSEAEPFGMLNSVKYQKFESQVRAILYVLKQYGLDKYIIFQYVAGDQELFKQTCTQIFGEGFIDYLNTISSYNNANSEEMLINLIVDYIKKNGLNIKAYWNSYKGDLYFSGSPTLGRAVVKAGKEYFPEDSQQEYSYFESSVKVADENDRFIDQEKVDRVKKYIDERFSLKGKTFEEIYETVIDLCSTYIQCKNKEDEESKIFISEITKLIPFIDDFQTKFRMLRVASKDTLIFENLDLSTITYIDIMNSMNALLEKDNGMIV